uniref:Phytocyanin domain-containing protein n=1 Tax=Oryza rufipogon TaxID=4529 RepID=A0A0E0QV01_ORYRU
MVPCSGQRLNKKGSRFLTRTAHKSNQIARASLSPPLTLPLAPWVELGGGAMACHLLLVAVVAGFAVSLAGATDHIVGANHGWNPNIDYSLWSGNQTFYVGDLISFRYQKGTHNVFEVNQTGYDNCTMAGVAGNWTSGKGFIPLNDSRRYYFICGNGFCQAGMKVAITVHPLKHNATGDGAKNHGGDGAAQEAAAAAMPGAAVWMAVLAVAAAAVAILP